jgi:hypothetical protein
VGEVQVDLISRESSDYTTDEQTTIVNLDAYQSDASITVAAPIPVSDAIKVICRFRPPRSTNPNAPAGSVSMGR